MAIYKYRARNSKGKVVTGQLEAPSETAATQQLSRNQLTPMAIQEMAHEITAGEFLSSALGVGKPKLQDLIIFARQMNTLTRAGVPLVKSITVVAKSTRSEGLQKALMGVLDQLEAGNSLSTGLQQFPTIFPPIVVSMVSVGESTGALEDAFVQVAHYLETEMETRKRIKSATRYPIFVFSAIAIAIGVINVLVIPAFKGFFARFGADLPLPTRILITSSEITLAYWPYLLAGFVAALIALLLYIRSDSGGILWDRFILKVPIIGKILHKALLARFARAFAMTMRAGVPLLQSLAVISNSVGNRYVTARILMMRAGLERGESLLQAANNSEMFTTMVLQMLSIGEETGELDSMLTQVAVYYEEEVDYDLKRLSDVIEPLLIMMVAGIVLVLALGVFLPMWDMSSVAMKKMGR